MLFAKRWPFCLGPQSSETACEFPSRLDLFTVLLHSLNDRYLPTIMAVQGDCE